MNQAQLAVDSQESSLLEQGLDLVCARSPVVKRTIDNYGGVSLADYLRQTLVISQNPLQPRNDLLEAVYRYAAPLLGETVAEKAAQELQTLPAVLTANHHGVDFLAQSVQNSLIFSLREVGGKPATTVPVLACGNVPLNNPTYPKGFLFYEADRHATEFKLPIRLPVFSDRQKRKSVSIVQAYDQEMLARAELRLAAMLRNKQLSPAGAAAAATIFGDYRSSKVMELCSYSEQAVILNNLIWKRCFSEPEYAPEMVCLELEKVSSLLLQLDLKNEDSLIWQLMFNPTVRSKVLKQLDGARACWDKNKITNRTYLGVNSNKPSCNGSGTTFFWGIDSTGSRVPLMLTNNDESELNLHGRDDQGNLWTIPFNATSILQGLQGGNLLPSLFTCYSIIGFARGINCCGGYFQAEYLLNIQRCLVTVLSETTGCTELAMRLSEVPSNTYLSGMQTVMRSLDNDFLLPVGPMEMIASGGISQNQIERIHSLTVRNTHLAGLTETLPDFLLKEDLPNNWYFQLAAESNLLLRDKIIAI